MKQLLVVSIFVLSTIALTNVKAETAGSHGPKAEGPTAGTSSVAPTGPTGSQTPPNPCGPRLPTAAPSPLAGYGY